VRPGTLPWLMRHELRLQWRGARHKVLSSFQLLLALIGLHLLAIPIGIMVRLAMFLPETLLLAGLTGVLAFVGLTMLSRSLILFVQAIYERGDSDLLLASPISPVTVVTARSLGVAAEVLFEFGMLLLPFAHVLAVLHDWRWLIAYLVLPSLTMLTLSSSLLIARSSFRFIGPRHTRTVAQLLAGLLAVVAAVFLQVPQLLMQKDRLRIAVHWLDGLSDISRAAFFPARLATGAHALESSAALMAVIVCFALSLRQTAPGFIRDLGAAGVANIRRARAPRGALRAFRGGLLRVLMAKEIRLLLRDPWLLTQLFQQLMLLAPISLVLLTSGSSGHRVAWATSIAAASTIAGSLAWLAGAGDEAPDLLQSAPLNPRLIRRAKLGVALLPVAASAWIPVLFLAFHDRPWSALATGACCMGSALCSALLHLRARGTSRKRDLRERYRGNMMLTLVDTSIMLLWMLVAVIALYLEGS
jgi:ABC-2 type transport system permease protein